MRNGTPTKKIRKKPAKKYVNIPIITERDTPTNTQVADQNIDDLQISETLNFLQEGFVFLPIIFHI